MPDIIPWLIALWVLSLVGFPIASALTGLGRLADRGWTVARPLALLLVMWLTWIGGTVGLIPNSSAGIAATVALVGIGAAVLAWRSRAELVDFLRRRWLLVGITEVVFLAVFAGWLLVVSEVPAINHTEKPMDFGIINAIASAEAFPPEDPWLSGHSIAYYYGGHYIAAMLATLTGVHTAVAYNLAVATVPALFAVGVAGLIYNVLRLAGARFWPALAVGVAAALGIGLLSNLTGILEFAHLRGWGGDGLWQWVGIKGLDSPGGEVLAGSPTGSGGGGAAPASSTP